MRRAQRDGRRAGAAAVPRRDRGAAADGGLHRGEQGGVRDLPRTRRRSWRASRSTRRSSTCAACGGSRARREQIAARLRARVRDEVGLPITVGVARRSSSPRSRAASPSRTGCSSSRPAASSRSCTRCRSSGCGASARSRPQAARAAGSRRSGEVAALGEGDADRDARARGGPAPARARPQPRPAPRSAPARRRARSGAQRALGRRPRSRRRSSTRSSSGSSTGSRGRLRDGRPRLPHGHAAPALRRLRARDALAHARRSRPRRRARSSPRARGCSAPRCR